MTVSINRILGGVLLVTGTCIGAGMLALPVSSAAAGFYPSLGAFIFCWIMMMISAFFMLEVSLWYPQETNLITMARETLGKGGEIIAWGTYVLFLYALLTAYTAGATGIIAKFLAYLGYQEKASIWVLVSIFATIVFLGAKWVDWANRLLIIGLAGGYMMLVSNVVPEVSHDLLTVNAPKFIWTTIPLLVTSFGFHLLIPSLRNYLKGDSRALRIAIFIGSTLPLIIYLLWEMLVLGVIPVEGEQGLVAMQYAERFEGKQAVIELTQLLSHILHNQKITFFARLFGLCAILTSFIGVALGLFDFFSDGFQIKKSIMGKLGLSLMTFLPPTLLVLYYPSFMMALHYAGFFAVILLVIFPAMMVWSGRYRLGQNSGYQVIGGKALVLFSLLFGLGVIGLEVMERMGKLPTPLANQHLFE